MNAVATESPLLLDYQLRLPTFEGPLDVLLRLIERDQLPVTDVSLMAVTEQFLAYVESLESVSPQVLAEFAAVGARLVLLKSRSLLPRPVAADDEAEPGDLAQQLIEYQTIKRAALELAQRDQLGIVAFPRARNQVAASEPGEPPRLAPHEPSWLAKALRRRLALIPSPREVVAARPLISLGAMVERVLRLLAGRREVLFSRVAADCQNAHEIRAAFLAVLVLIRRRAVDADQAELFGDITLRRRSGQWRGLLDPLAAPSGDD